MKLFSSVLLAGLMILAGASATAQTHTLPLPARPAGAPTGSQFYNQIVGITNQNTREAAIVTQIASGNVPDFLRTLVPVTVTATINSQLHTATYYVTPDYMAIGTDADFFRMPMSAPLAQQIANIVNCNMPTRKMVNNIWTASTVKLSPHPFSPATYTIDSVEVFWLSQQAIESDRAGRAGLISGIKKDVVVTTRLNEPLNPARVAIYGWHYTNGTAIQPLSLVHEATYEDYSHGIRLVEKTMTVDGASAQLPAIIAHATLNVLVSDEGAFTTTSYPNPTTYPVPVGTPTVPPPTTPPPPPPLVDNGSFEEPFGGNGVAGAWLPWSATGSNTLTYGRAAINHYDGAYSQYWSRNDTLLLDGGVYQVFTVEPGATYQITAWMKRQSTFVGTVMQFGYDANGGTDGTAAGVVYSDLSGGADNIWVQSTASAVATGGAMTLFARGGHTGTTGGTNAYFYLDAVSVTKTAEPVKAINTWQVY